MWPRSAWRLCGAKHGELKAQDGNFPRKTNGILGLNIRVAERSLRCGVGMSSQEWHHGAADGNLPSGQENSCICHWNERGADLEKRSHDCNPPITCPLEWREQQALSKHDSEFLRMTPVFEELACCFQEYAAKTPNLKTSFCLDSEVKTFDKRQNRPTNCSVKWNDLFENTKPSNDLILSNISLGFSRYELYILFLKFYQPSSAVVSTLNERTLVQIPAGPPLCSPHADPRFGVSKLPPSSSCDRLQQPKKTQWVWIKKYSRNATGTC